MNHIDDYIEQIYKRATSESAKNTILAPSLSSENINALDEIINRAESAKGVLAVVLTGLVYKIHHPEQDVRKHQSSIDGGYSGRTFDSKHITPFLKRNRFPAMAESGWLTRSLEQKVAYNEGYPGAIKPTSLKNAFLYIYAEMERSPMLCEDMLLYLIQSLTIKRDKEHVAMARPHNLSISEIIKLLATHFNHRYSVAGASRLPVLAIYACYQVMMLQMKRFDGKKLLPLAQHNSADLQSGRLGDIDIIDENESPFEAVEVKLGIPISHDIVLTAKDKINPTSVKRYYILSTTPITESEKNIIDQDISQIKNIHGCQVVVNGVIDSLKYYLRLLDGTSDFIDRYAYLLETDKDIKFEHRTFWNELVANL